MFIYYPFADSRTVVRPLDQAILDMNETQYLKSIHVTCKEV